MRSKNVPHGEREGSAFTLGSDVPWSSTAGKNADTAVSSLLIFAQAGLKLYDRGVKLYSSIIHETLVSSFDWSSAGD